MYTNNMNLDWSNNHRLFVLFESCHDGVNIGKNVHIHNTYIYCVKDDIYLYHITENVLR